MSLTKRILLGVLAAVLFISVIVLLGFITDRWLLSILTGVAFLLVVVAFFVVRNVVGREREDRLELGLEDDEDFDADQARGGAASDLKGRFREAIVEIRRSLGGRTAVYELPWYLVFGDTGSGKSALMQESGLELPAQYRASRFFGPTQSCDFWLFNEAIALDTAGRYFGSEADDDRSEWRNLLGLLRASRPDCPVEGLVFTISAETLLTESSAELEERARVLRRRLNEIQLGLAVDAPIYLIVTKADKIEGFVETAERLPAERRSEAFGWTNDQRRVADPEMRIGEAFADIRARLDGFAYELILREPDAVRRRRIFMFPQELEEVGRAMGRFAATAFKRDRYSKSHFLRGVYLTSARAEGEGVSPTLARLGHAWARTQHSSSSGPSYMRDLFREILILDDLAHRESRLGPTARRAVLAMGALVVACVLGVWGTSFYQNYRGSHSLQESTELALSADPTIQHISRLRTDIERRQHEAGLYVNLFGFGMLDRAVERAKRSFVHAFGRNFVDDTRQNLSRALRQRDDNAFRAAVAVGADLEWLATLTTDEGAEPPDLTPYMPRRVRDGEGFMAGYRVYSHWLRAPDRETMIDEQRDALAHDSRRLLNLGGLENQTRKGQGKFAPVRYATLGFGTDEGEGRGAVPGIYTRAGFDGLFGYLLSAVERTGSVSERELSALRRSYVDRYDRSWRRFLVETPNTPRAFDDVRKSPYLALLDKIDANTNFDLPRDSETPSWVTALREVRRTEVVGEEKSAPWQDYTAAIESVAIDVEDAIADGAQALLVARDVAQGKPSTFGDAMEVVRRIVPRRGDALTRTKLRAILEGPVLDGFQALLISARGELDKRWRERVHSRYSAGLTQAQLDALYTPGTGELDAFKTDELQAFFKDNTPRKILGDRAMPFGKGFLNWMSQAGQLQRSLFAGRGGSPSVAVRLKGVPSRIEGATDLRVKRRTLRLICPDGEQDFVYREGSGSTTFNWSSNCEEVELRILLGGSGLSDQQLRRSWTGPLALPQFLREARRVSGGVLQWTFSEPGGANVLIRYRLVAGRDIVEIAHTSPPSSLGG